MRPVNITDAIKLRAGKQKALETADPGRLEPAPLLYLLDPLGHQLEAELGGHLRALMPKPVIRIRKGSSNGVELTGLQLDEERKQVMKIMQKVWEDDSWLH